MNDSSLIELARKMQSNFFEKLSGKDITEKQTMAASLIMTADTLIDILIFEDGNGLKIDEMTQFLATHGEVSSDSRAYEWLMDWIAQNNQKLGGRDDVPETWGKTEVDRISIIRSVFNKACTEKGYNPSSFLSWMRRNNLIETEGKGFTKRIRINGMKCQCVILKRNVIPDYGSVEMPKGFEEVPENEQMEF